MKKCLIIFLLLCSSVLAHSNRFQQEYTNDEIDAFFALVNYAFVTGNDVLTDILATELETLTDGSEAQTLHIHDTGYVRRSLVNGTFAEPFDALVTSDGATVTLTVTNSVSGNLTMQTSAGDVTFITSSPTNEIILTAGSDTSPTNNFIFIPQNTGVLTKSTSDFPTDAEHIKVGYFLVPSEGFVQTNGAYVNQNWNDPLKLTSDQGRISSFGERSRRLGAKYHAGIDGNGTDGYLTPTASNVELKVTAGVVYQMNRHVTDPFDTSTGDVVLVNNWPGDPFHDITNLFDITTDSGGNTITPNRYFNLILWCATNKSGEYSPMLINLPGGFYNTATGAASDSSGHDDFSFPDAFDLQSSTGVLIARITIQMGTTWTVVSTVDLRKSNPQSASGGVSSVINEFADNVFKIFDETSLDELSFVLDNLTANHTITMPDADVTLLSMQSGAQGALELLTQAELEILDGATVTTTELNYLDGTTLGVATASNVLAVDSSLDIGAIRNLSITGVFTDGNYTFDTSGNVTGLGNIDTFEGDGNFQIAAAGSISGEYINVSSESAEADQAGIARGIFQGDVVATLEMDDVGATVDQRRFIFVNLSGDFFLRRLDDDGGNVVNAMSIDLVQGDVTMGAALDVTGALGITGDAVFGNRVTMDSLPTSDPVNAGELWNDNGDLMISEGS